jgi:hypothetical protein
MDLNFCLYVILLECQIEKDKTQDREVTNAPYGREKNNKMCYNAALSRKNKIKKKTIPNHSCARLKINNQTNKFLPQPF